MYIYIFDQSLTYSYFLGRSVLQWRPWSIHTAPRTTQSSGAGHTAAGSSSPSVTTTWS